MSRGQSNFRGKREPVEILEFFFSSGFGIEAAPFAYKVQYLGFRIWGLELVLLLVQGLRDQGSKL